MVLWSYGPMVLWSLGPMVLWSWAYVLGPMVLFFILYPDCPVLSQNETLITSFEDSDRRMIEMGAAQTVLAALKACLPLRTGCAPNPNPNPNPNP